MMQAPQSQLAAGRKGSGPAIIHNIPQLKLLALPLWSGQQHLAPSKAPSWICGATRDVEFAYQKDIQTKLKPSVFADRMDNKVSHLQAAQDWQTVVKLFSELGEDTDRNVGLVGEMLVALQRLAPPAAAGAGAGAGRLPPAEARQLAVGTAGMCNVLLDNLDRVGHKQLINAIWALALLPDPSKTLNTPAAAAARARAVAGFGAVVLNRMNKLQAEDLFHVLAGLALLGFRPPRTLQRDDDQQESDKNKELQTGAEEPEAAARKGPVMFGALLERRSIKVMQYLNAKGLADAGFVISRLVAAGDMSEEWLGAYATATQQQLATMQPEALVYAGYALTRHGFRASNSWQKAYIRALQSHAKTLAGEEFPMALFTLARWHQQQQQQQPGTGHQQQPWEQEEEEEDDLGPVFGSSGSAVLGTDVPQGLLDTLLLASHTNRALKELPLGQLVVMVTALAELQLPVSNMWLQRLWPAINAKIDAAVEGAAAGAGAGVGSRAAGGAGAAAAVASDLAGLVTAIPRLNPRPSLPADFVEGLAGNLGVGLQRLRVRELAVVWAALQQLQHEPDAIFMRQMQQATLAAAAQATGSELMPVLQLGLALALTEPPGSSSSSSKLLDVDAFLESFVGSLQQSVHRQVGRAASALASSSAVGGVDSQAAAQELPPTSGGSGEGLWELPTVLLSGLQLVAATAAQQQQQQLQQPSSNGRGAAVAGVLQQAVAPALQSLWCRAVVGLAAVMPTDPLLVAMGNVLDLSPEDQMFLGLTSDGTQQQQEQEQKQGQLGSRAAVIEAILESGVYPRISTSSSAAGSGTRGGRSAAAAAAAAAESFYGRWSVADCVELLVILADADVVPQLPLLDAAAEVLRRATSLSKDPPQPRFPCTHEDADELVRELSVNFGYGLPSRVKGNYRKWRWPEGPPPEPKKPRKAATAAKKASSSSSRKVLLQPAAVPAAAAATAPRAADPAPAAADPAPAIEADGSGIVRSSRSRPASRPASL